ncbi:MAG: hypothetical protein M3135_03115 [Actinomycetota bacterium]|nr:hypothetical protein [Actinomycetota bacterium]
MSPVVEFADPEPNGLAAMIGGLLQANLEAHPERADLLTRALVGVMAQDAHVSITLELSPDRIVVRNGLAPRTDVTVRTDSETLTELSTTPLRLGYPDATKTEGRRITRKLLSGDLAVRGLVRHPLVVSRLNRLLAVD